MLRYTAFNGSAVTPPPPHIVVALCLALRMHVQVVVAKDAASAAQRATAGSECGDKCAPTWAQCGGNKNVRACCSSSDFCVRKSEHYAQCRPKARGLPADWPAAEVLMACNIAEGACRRSFHLL